MQGWMHRWIMANAQYWSSVIIRDVTMKSFPVVSRMICGVFVSVTILSNKNFKSFLVNIQPIFPQFGYLPINVSIYTRTHWDGQICSLTIDIIAMQVYKTPDVDPNQRSVSGGKKTFSGDFTKKCQKSEPILFFGHWYFISVHIYIPTGNLLASSNTLDYTFPD